MRAVEQSGYRGEASLRLNLIAVPPPRKGEVRVRVLACGANASDWEYATGSPGYARLAGAFRPDPRVLGSDILGVVDATGPGVDLPLGTRVLADTMGTFGGFADYAVAKAESWVPVPESIPDIVAAALPQSGTIALTAMEDVQPGQRVLINGGGGGSGPFAIQMAKARGAHVTAVDSAAKAAVMQAAGADEVIDFHQTDFAQMGQTWDVILDLWGTRPARRIGPVLAEGGGYMLVGGPVPILLNIVAAGLLGRYAEKGRFGLLMVKQGPARLAELLGLVEAGRLTAHIGEVAPLDTAIDALARMGAGQIAGKLVIKP